ncbi:hypothetical protein [Niallia sp. NCCP-28]|uniref:hypothetical protein n=1 Tax=Niallia sp. NCCP-28 TaxID=2934712 RepID=UPI0020882513|nr:hypothetical protein [Niallia sp. NCCP-28]GKU83166.1 hypothetical protein NCCP28_25620 [Niallia sp. NCCP-28]
MVHKICLSLFIFGIIFIGAFCINQMQKREFYSPIDSVASENLDRFFINVDMRFEPREYIRQIADDSLEEGSR